METPQSTQRLTPVTALIPEDDRKQLDESAAANDRTLAAEVRRAIRYYLEHGQ